MLTSSLLSILAHVRLAPFQLSLDTAGFRPTAALLRGVWGAALHQLDRAAYEAVFAPDERTAVPGYLLATDPTEPTMVHWRLLGASLLHEESLHRAWDIAAGMGLGSARRRFVVRRFVLLGWEGQVAELPEAWTLDRVQWPLAGDPAGSPCRLVFPAGLRLLRDGHLLSRPTLADIAVASLRRLYPLLPDHARADLDELHEPVVALARRWKALPWQGERHDLQRWSARQKREIELHGVQGELELPEGPGPLWPLLAAARWLHVGKGTTVGLGQMMVVSVPPIAGPSHRASGGKKEEMDHQPAG